MKWQPIENAPKDGTWVMLCGGSVAWSHTGDDEDKLIHPCVVATWNDGQWVITHYDTGVGVVQYDNPKHWMPLPDPPVVEMAKAARSKHWKHCFRAIKSAIAARGQAVRILMAHCRRGRGE